MGQYWTMKNLDKREVLGTHAFGSGLKFLEQWFSGALYTAAMVLLTDTSSLGHGGGDFRLNNVPEELKKFISPVIGSWAGDRIVFAGDYTEVKEHEESDENGNETFTDISDRTALAIWTMVACDLINLDNKLKDDAKTVKSSLIEFLKSNVCEYHPWTSASSVKKLFEAIDNLIPEQTNSSATKESNPTECDNGEQSCANKKLCTASASDDVASSSVSKTEMASETADPASSKKRKVGHRG